MRFTFLGTGTSAGVPAIGATGGANDSDDPRDTRLRTSACLRFEDPSGHERTVLIDCSPDMRQQALTAKLTRADAILFTHNHVDHCWGLDEVRRFNVLMNAPIDLYADEHTLTNLRRVYAHIFNAESNINRSFVATLIPHTIAAEHPFELYGLKITPIRVLHGRQPILGFRLDRADSAPASFGAGLLPLAYCTDVSAIPPETWPHLDGLEHLVLDALRHRAHPTHMTLDRAVETAARIGAGSTYFIHMSYEIVHAEVDPSLPQGMHLAYDGLDLPAAASHGLSATET